MIATRLPAVAAAIRRRCINAVNETAWWLVIHGSGPMLALAWLVRRTVGRRLQVIVVVGTYGKTTTTRAIRAMLGLPASAWVDANANCLALVPLALFRGMLESRTVVIEVGIARPGRMARYAWALRPSVVVVTCVGNEHIQSFRDALHLREEKGAMVRVLPPTATAVLNGDDPNVLWMATTTRARVLTFGRRDGADVVGGDVVVEWPAGTSLNVTAAGRTLHVRTRLVGDGMATCVLAAVGAAVAAGLPLEPAVAALATLPPTPGRLQPVPLPGGAVVLRDDYKSTVETVVAAIDTLARLPAGRRIVVLGDLDSPPAPERPWYRDIGERVARVADEVLFVGAKHDRYLPGLRRAGRVPAYVHAVRTTAEAAAYLAPRLGVGDVVLVKGRESQRLTRVILALEGRRVGCTIPSCHMHLTFCDRCPLLGAGAAPGGGPPPPDHECRPGSTATGGGAA